MQFKDLAVKTMQAKAAYDKYNQTLVGKTWNRENIAEGLIGDVEDLMKLVIVKEDLRQIEWVSSRSLTPDEVEDTT